MQMFAREAAGSVRERGKGPMRGKGRKGGRVGVDGGGKGGQRFRERKELGVGGKNFFLVT